MRSRQLPLIDLALISIHHAYRNYVPAGAKPHLVEVEKAAVALRVGNPAI
jgi:hypothetical protein